ncbi:MAG: hypothetical protein ABI045_00875 [Flavobacteriales bacterium]
MNAIEKVIEAARKNNDKLMNVFMHAEQFNQLKRNDQVKARYYSFLNLIPGNCILPSVSKVNEYFLEDYELRVMDSVMVRIEKNSNQSSLNSRKTDKVTFSEGLKMGDLAYGRTQEEKHSVNRSQIP